jgi:hypothetical protein
MPTYRAGDTQNEREWPIPSVTEDPGFVPSLELVVVTTTDWTGLTETTPEALAQECFGVIVTDGSASAQAAANATRTIPPTTRRGTPF